MATPTDKALYARVKAAAKKKFKVYPCVPVRSCAVGRKGLVRSDELCVGDEILAYDTNADVLVWSVVSAVNRYANAETIRIKKATGFSLECTPDHRWVWEKRGRQRATTYRGGRLGTTYVERSLITASEFKARGHVVWCAKLLSGERFKDTSWVKHESWTANVLAMTPEEREVFLAAAIVYDGCDYGDTQTREGRRFGFSQKNLDHWWACVLAAFCNGYYVSMRQKKNTDIQSAVIIRGKRVHDVQNMIVEPSVKQDVWCPVTEHGTWVMVQDGVICVTGNSAYANGWLVQEYKKRGGRYSGADSRGKKGS